MEIQRLTNELNARTAELEDWKNKYNQLTAQFNSMKS